MRPPKRAAKKSKPKPKLAPDARPQRERFIEAAEKAGVDGEAFERAMGQIAKAKRRAKK